MSDKGALTIFTKKTWQWAFPVLFFLSLFVPPVSQDPESKYFLVKGNQGSKTSSASSSLQLPFDVPLSPYTKDGTLVNSINVKLILNCIRWSPRQMINYIAGLYPLHLR